MIVNLSQQWFLLPAAKRHGFAELYVKKGNLWILVDCSFIICLELLLQIMRIFISFYTILNKSGIFWNVFKFWIFFPKFKKKCNFLKIIESSLSFRFCLKIQICLNLAAGSL